MHLSHHSLLLATAGLSIALHAGNLRADFGTGEAADIVLGQSTFNSASAATSPSGLKFPESVAVDPTTGKVFVADVGNNRVLRYSSTAAMASGSSAEAVFGQPNLSSSSANLNQNGMDGPEAVYVDAGEHLWVSDSNNQRVLRFDNASTRTSTAADGVLGQATFTTSATTPVSASSLDLPNGLCVDSAGNLWVADEEDSRVLRFDHAATLGNGAAAKVVLGQASFALSAFATSQSRLSNPQGVFADATGTVWVADTGNNRVLRFNGAVSLADNTTGVAASGVIGQTSYTADTANSGTEGLSRPLGLAVDASGNLYVADFFNNRVLRYPQASSILTDGTPDLALGQVSLTTGTAPNPPTAFSMSHPSSVTLDPSGRIWVADTNNARVLHYSPISVVPVPAPSPLVQISGKKSRTTTLSKLKIKGTASDAGGTLARIQVKVGHKSYKTAKGTSPWQFTASLKPGKNKILVRAVDASGTTSTPAKLTIVRQ